MWGSMRLTEAQCRLLKDDIRRLDAAARVFLFGSRTDDDKTGGDIDLLIFSTKLDNKQLRPVKWHFYEQFGEQKMDVLIDSGNLDSPFVKMIFSGAVEL